MLFLFPQVWFQCPCLYWLQSQEGKKNVVYCPFIVAHSWATFQWQGRLISSPFLDSEHVSQHKAESFWEYLSYSVANMHYAYPYKNLKEIHPIFPTGPVISHNHMLRRNVYLSFQLSGDRNTKDSCDSGEMALLREHVMPKPKPRLSHREALRSGPCTYHRKGPVHIEANPKDKIDWVTEVLLCSGSILKCHA